MTSDGTRKPTVADVDPNVLAVNSMSDQQRTHGNQDETERVVLGDGSTATVDDTETSVEANDTPS
jgi:hypothetical protein